MLHGKTIEQMKNQFIEITLEICTIKEDKYTQRELNQKVIRALPASWHMYVTRHPNIPDFNKLTVEELLDLLIKNEYEMIHIHGAAHTSSIWKKPEPEKKDKDIAFKAVEETATPPSTQIQLSAMEKLLQDFTLFARRNERLESRMSRYKIFYNDSKRVGNNYGHPAKNSNKGGESKPNPSKYNSSNLPVGSCFHCQRLGHYNSECPYLSQVERDTLWAKRDRKLKE